MSEKPPSKFQQTLVNLSWFAGVEGAALIAFVLGLHYVVTRLIQLCRGQ